MITKSSKPGFLIITATVYLFVLGRCATPQFPEGGPVDNQPPFVVTADPDTNETNVATDRLIIDFSEYINTGSFQQALSITPAFSRPPQIRWRGRRAEVRFPEELRDSTTYVITIDKTLRDLNGVSLTRPITWAFSSGSKIDQGVISGRVIDPGTGRGIDGFDLFAFEGGVPTSWNTEPEYRIQTDEQGVFRLQFLPETPFFVLALEDRNRNRQPDADERTGIPFSEALLPTISDTVKTSLPLWLVALGDTTAPVIRRVRSVSSRRHVVYHSEDVRLVSIDPDQWTLTDSASGERVEIEALYSDNSAPQQVTFVTDSLANALYRVIPQAIADSSGNLLRTAETYFMAPARRDTVGTRFIGFDPNATRGASETILENGDLPSVRFNQPVDTLTLRSALSVRDTVGTVFSYSIENRDGRSYAVKPIRLPDGAAFLLEISGSYFGTDSLYTGHFRWRSLDEMGGIVGIVEGSDRKVVLELYSEQTPRRIRVSTPDSSGAFSFSRLPEGTYKLRYFHDKNEDGVWNSGSARPFAAPEPYGWYQENISVRRRFETEVDTLFPAYNVPYPVSVPAQEERE